MTDETLFAQALGMDTGGRDALLAAVPPDVRRRVERLLVAHARAGDFLAYPAAPAPPPIEVLADRYRLREAIGQGGMGVVYRAEQTAPVRRTVAVKVIRPGMASTAAVARFEAERQALARMDHPNIAAVFDGGTTPDGRPFFVMELVDGLPITRFCDDRRLSLTDRLGLLVAVARAVQHAHTKGVIHRDLKPSNILVADGDGGPVPKVIDFGVAKAVGPAAGDGPADTRVGTLVGTPQYMAPEQADLSARDADTRSDVYALAAVLYELVTGTPPLHRDTPADTPLLDLLQAVRDEEPPSASTRLRAASDLPAVAARRKADPARLVRQVRGELDWVLAKGLEKDRDRRYESAAAFADDLVRLTRNEPVAAGPSGRLYQARKFVRRNRPMVLAGLALVGTLAAGTSGTTVGMMRAWDAERQARRAESDARSKSAAAVAAEGRAAADRDRAVAAEADATAFNEFFVQHVLAASRPDRVRDGLGKHITLADAVAAAEPALDRAFAGRPAAEAKARHAIGLTWSQLGRYPDAERQLRQALDIQQRVAGPDARETIAIQVAILQLLYHTSQLGPARQLGEEVCPRAEAVLGPDAEETLSARTNLALVYTATDRRDDALAIFRDVAARRERVNGTDHISTLVSRNNIALALNSIGRRTEARETYAAVLARMRAVCGPDEPEVVTTINNLARAYKADGRVRDAIDLYEDGLRRAEALYGDVHRITLVLANNLAAAYLADGRVKDAIRLFEQTRDRRLAAPGLGPDHKDTLTSMNTLAVAYKADNRLDDAIALQREVLDRRTRLLGPEHSETLTTAHNLGQSYLAAGRPDDAVLQFERVAVAHGKQPRPNPHDVAATNCALAETYVRLGRDVEAEPRLRVALRHFQTPDGRRSVLRPTALRALAALLVRADKPAEAEPFFRDCLAILDKADPKQAPAVRSELGDCLTRLDRYDEAEQALLAAVRVPVTSPAAERHLRATHARLADLYEKWGKPEKAAEWRAKPLPPKD